MGVGGGFPPFSLALTRVGGREFEDRVAGIPAKGDLAHRGLGGLGVPGVAGVVPKAPKEKKKKKKKKKQQQGRMAAGKCLNLIAGHQITQIGTINLIAGHQITQILST